MSVESPVDKDSPLYRAWLAYKATDDFVNTRKWARVTENTEGSLWAAFVEGFNAASRRPAPAGAPAKVTDEDVREVEDELAWAIYHVDVEQFRHDIRTALEDFLKRHVVTAPAAGADAGDVTALRERFAKILINYFPMISDREVRERLADELITAASVRAPATLRDGTLTAAERERAIEVFSGPHESWTAAMLEVLADFKARIVTTPSETSSPESSRQDEAAEAILTTIRSGLSMGLGDFSVLNSVIAFCGAEPTEVRRV